MARSADKSSQARGKAAGPRPGPGPILNGPYDEPRYHCATARDGNLDYRDRREGRRVFAPDTPQVPLGSTGQQGLYDINELAGNYRDYLVNLLREQLGAWRSAGYPGVTSRVTRDLLAYWFENAERASHQRLFFAQREAVEAAIWLNEVADKSNPGAHILNQLRRAQASVGDVALTLPRVAFKMATGTGKTVVMACLLLYHYLNRAHQRNDPRYADYFLIVAPGVTIRDRLSVLRFDTEAAADHLSADYHGQRKLVPPAYAPLMAGLNARLVITNFHGFEPRLIGGNKRSPLDGKLGPDGRKVEAREDEAGVLRRLLPSFKTGRRLLVINDEAHHCYLPRAKGRDTDEELGATENERAAVWYSGLRAASRRWQLRAVYDLSATPYYLSGSGWPAYSHFPWVVSDFSLIEAIEAGLVKIPFLPVDESAQHIEEPVLRSLYEHCKELLPRKGQRTQRREELAESAEEPVNGKGRAKKNAPISEAPPHAHAGAHRHGHRLLGRARGAARRPRPPARPGSGILSGSPGVVASFPRRRRPRADAALRRPAPHCTAVECAAGGPGGRTRPELQRLQDPAAVAASVFLGIEAAALLAEAGSETSPVIVPLLNHHNPSGSTAHVHGSTTKEVFVTTKSHVNFVVADTDHWEQVAAKTFEQHAHVESYVKNAYLGFEVPYVEAAGTECRYLPDFILRVVTPGGEGWRALQFEGLRKVWDNEHDAARDNA